MSFAERYAKLDRVQRSRLFKIIASCVVGLLTIGGIVAYVVAQHVPADALTIETPEGADEDTKSAIQDAQRLLSTVFSARADPTSVAIGIGVVGVLLLAVIWLGLGLTALLLALVAAALVVPMHWWKPTRTGAQLLGGVLALTAAFVVLMRALQVACSGAGPVMAVARNVLSEAVRLKLSLVFIVLLIFGLSYLPSMLETDSPLRYRVQSFLQYGTGGSFWIIAILTLVFSVSTVAFEQRDKTIWQTMTKPVASWQYVLGKWVGVVGLNAVLLTVCASAVFLFTEYLRQQPARGEQQAFVTSTGAPSDDRLILETRVLRSSVVVQNDPPTIVESEFQKSVALRVENETRSNSQFRDTPEVRRQIESDLRKSINQAYRSLEPGRDELYVFSGLSEAKRDGLPLTFKYRIDSGANRPDDIYRMTFAFGPLPPQVNETGLGYSHTLAVPARAISDDGTLTVQVMNGDLSTGQVNTETATFPAGGMEISYSTGSYRANFVRVIAVLWVKLAFLAMMGICAATFLSFPVACLVAFGCFLMAESAGYLAESLENYASVDDKGNVIPFAVVVNAIGVAVSRAFKVYSDLRPTTKLVDGIRLSWQSIAVGVLVLGTSTAALYGIAVGIFRRRELATYSGH